MTAQAEDLRPRPEPDEVSQFFWTVPVSTVCSCSAAPTARCTSTLLTSSA